MNAEEILVSLSILHELSHLIFTVIYALVWIIYWGNNTFEKKWQPSEYQKQLYLKTTYMCRILI